ncbi:MAG TPA: hypothetical protein P5525_13350 [Candidatus Paceibacterota bacterium]|nr:hypothetical protein [Candidatus Paceibacterota bacterium]
MHESIVIIGAGSAMFTRGLVADLLQRNRPCTLSLVDCDADALAVAEGMTRKMIAARRAPITLRAAMDRRDVLPSATAVICTIGVGGRRAQRQAQAKQRQRGIQEEAFHVRLLEDHFSLFTLHSPLFTSAQSPPIE